MLRFIKALYLLINVIIIITLITLHFFIKESSYMASLYFYLFPLPIIILIILGLSIFLGKKRKYNIVLATVLLIVWLGRSFRISFPQDINETDIEVVFWNASRENGFDEAFMEHGSIPDVMALSESIENNLGALQSKYPHFYFYKSNEEIIIFSKKPIIIEKEETSKFGSTMISFTTHNIHFYAVDMTGSADVPRAWEFKFLNPLIKKSKNTVLLGDFNVPYESLFLHDIKHNFHHFFSRKGNGFRETWFYNIPLLSLDHIWVSKDLEIVKSEKINTLKSDHSMIKTIVRK